MSEAKQTTPPTEPIDVVNTGEENPVEKETDNQDTIADSQSSVDTLRTDLQTFRNDFAIANKTLIEEFKTKIRLLHAKLHENLATSIDEGEAKTNEKLKEVQERLKLDIIKLDDALQDSFDSADRKWEELEVRLKNFELRLGNLVADIIN